MRGLVTEHAPRPVIAGYLPHGIVCLLSGVRSFQNQKRGCAADQRAADVTQSFFFYNTATANLFLWMFPFIHLRLTLSHSISYGAGILGAIDRPPSKNRIALNWVGGAMGRKFNGKRSAMD